VSRIALALSAGRLIKRLRGILSETIDRGKESLTGGKIY